LRFLFDRGLLILTVAAAAFGCQVYDETLVDAGIDGGPGSDAGPCNSRTPPPRPTEADMPGGDEILFGLRAVELEQEDGDAWREIGLDLDGLCTEAPDFASPCRPPRRARPPADGNDGIDNVFGGELFPLVDLAVGGLQPLARQAQEEGRMPVVRIRGWNGTDNDSRIDITVTNAIYVVPEVDGMPHPHTVENFIPVNEGMPVPFPTWDGTDYGFFRDETFLGGNPDQPLLRDDNAYVADRMVVAQLPERFEILFPAEDVGVLVRLTNATATGRISDDGMTLENTVVSGRWSIIDLLSTAENVGICRDSDSYDILLGQLDTVADVRSRAGSGGVDAVCDAISVGVRFTGTRLQWGGLTPGPPVTNACIEADGGTMSLDGGVPMDGG